MNKNGTTSQGVGSHHNFDERLDSIKEKARGLVDRGEHKVDEIRSRVIDAKDQAMSKGNVAMDKVNEFVRANPLKAIGAAFALGYFGMRLFRR